MRIISIILAAALAGVLVGGAVGYVQVRSDLDAITQYPGETEVMPAAKGEAVPVVSVPEPHFDFGTMQRGTSKSHEFEIKNVGQAPLTLRAGTTSCKCTLSEVSEAAIPPGGTTKVKVQWTAKIDSGPFRQTANVLTNDPLHSTIEFEVEGKVMSASGVEPPDFLFEKLPVGEERSSQVYVMAMLQDDLKVSDPQLSDPQLRDRFTVKIDPVDPSELPNKTAKRGVRITVTVKPGMPVGRFHQWLSLTTNLPEAEHLEIPVSGQVVGDISVHGTGWIEERGALRIGAVKSSEGAHQKVSIMVRGPEAPSTTFKLQSVTPDVLQVKVGEPKKLSETLVQVPLEVDIPAGARPMVHLDTAQGEPGHIVLSTTHPKIKELGINVEFAVER